MPVPRQDPPRECDLVMKGGVTSGIVYPAAVLKLAEQYRFRCIGGTSVGAIAAAITAAAEFDRAGGGFERLKGVKEQLSQDGFLLSLFQPTRASRPLFTLLLEAVRTWGPLFSHNAGGATSRPVILRILRDFLTLMRRHLPDARRGGRVGATLGLVLAIVIGMVASFLLGSGSMLEEAQLILAVGLPFALIGRWIGSLWFGATAVYRTVTRSVPNNFFGICSGMAERFDDPHIGLTEWLCRTINEIAGRSASSKPLTFHDLDGRRLEYLSVTSNLSQNHPYVLAFEKARFAFKIDDFRKLFPAFIVGHLLKHAYRPKTHRLPAGYSYLPNAKDWPIALAARLSLSFPILISAVPLYSISGRTWQRRRRRVSLLVEEEDLQLNWFSDGGICSNFPIHFFDDWLPGRPSFGINLSSLPPDAMETPIEGPPQVRANHLTLTRSELATAAPSAPIGDIYLPRPNEEPPLDWKLLNTLPRFVWAIFSTAQGYRDNAQSRLPSYRDRIVEIRLRAGEGGLNLAMHPEAVRSLAAKGDLAGQTLLDRFNFRHHQWVRLRVLMGEFENEFRELQQVLDVYAGLIANQDRGTPYPRRDEGWCREAMARLDHFSAMLRAWQPRSPGRGPGTVFEEHLPRPRPVLRVTPEL